MPDVPKAAWVVYVYARQSLMLAVGDIPIGLYVLFIPFQQNLHLKKYGYVTSHTSFSANLSTNIRLLAQKYIIIIPKSSYIYTLQP